MTKSVGKKSQYAPKDYQETGVIEYLNAGADLMIEKRREDAFKKMYTACNGDYKILREGNKSSFVAVNKSDGQYWMIEFKCND